jgi:hypothetical protein
LLLRRFDDQNGCSPSSLITRGSFDSHMHSLLPKCLSGEEIFAATGVEVHLPTDLQERCHDSSQKPRRARISTTQCNFKPFEAGHRSALAGGRLYRVVLAMHGERGRNLPCRAAAAARNGAARRSWPAVLRLAPAKPIDGGSVDGATCRWPHLCLSS